MMAKKVEFRELFHAMELYIVYLVRRPSADGEFLFIYASRFIWTLLMQFYDNRC